MTHTQRYALPDLIDRLRTFGAHRMDEHGNLSDFQPNHLTAAAADAVIMLLAELRRHQQAGDDMLRYVRCSDNCLGTATQGCTCMPGHARIVWQHIRSTWAALDA